MPSWKISVLSHAAEPGSRPPTSPWCAVVVAKPIERLVEEHRLEDEDVLQVDAAVERVVHHEDVAGVHAVAPLREQRLHRVRHRAEVERDRDRLRDRLAVASQSAAEKSMPSRTTVECAVRKIVVAISSAIDASALPTISCVIGSIVRVLMSRSRISVSVAASRRTVQPGRTTTVVSYSSISSGPGSAALADRRARADRQLAERRRPRVALRTAKASSRLSRSTAFERPSAASRSARISIGEPSSPRMPYRRSCSSSNAAISAAQVGRVADLDLDLPRLAAVAELGRADELDAVEIRSRARAKTASSSAGSTVRASRWHVRTVVELRARVEQAERAEEPGERGHEHRAAAELLGEADRVHRAGAAVRDEREVARVAALLRRDGAQRARHARVRDRVDAGGDARRREPERLGDALERLARRARARP